MNKSQWKLKGLKESVKKWKKDEFDNIFADKKILETQLQEIHTIGMNNEYTTNLHMEGKTRRNSLAPKIKESMPKSGAKKYKIIPAISYLEDIA